MLEGESAIRVGARAAENLYGIDSQLTQKLRSAAECAIKFYAEDNVVTRVELDRTEALLLNRALTHMYDGFPYHHDGKGQIHEWGYGDRLQAANILNMEPPEEAPGGIVASEAVLRHESFWDEPYRPVLPRPRALVTEPITEITASMGELIRRVSVFLGGTGHDYDE